MELFKLLISINLLLITVKTVTAKKSDLAETERINKQTQAIKMLYYEVNLTIYTNKEYKQSEFMPLNIYETFNTYIDEQEAKGKFIFYGELVMFFDITNNETHKMHLHIRNLKIDTSATKIMFNNSALKTDAAAKTIMVRKTPPIYICNETIEIVFDNDYKPEYTPYILFMPYIGSVTDDNTGGIVRMPYVNDEGDKRWLITTVDFGGTKARQIFPCWNKLDIRTANIKISINNDAKYTFISTAPVLIDPLSIYPMIQSFLENKDATFPLHVALIDFNNVSGINVWYRQQVKEQIKLAQVVVQNGTLYLKQIFQKNFPWTVNHIVIPSFPDEGKETQDLVLYRELDVIYDEEIDTFAWKFEVVRMVAHKTVHQFIRSRVKTSTWPYLWLNQGITTFLAMEIVDQSEHFPLKNLYVVQLQHDFLLWNDYCNMTDRKDNINKLLNTNSFSPFIYYIKAPIFLRSLLETYPKDLLLRAIKIYLTNHHLEPIDESKAMDNFINVLEDVIEPTTDTRMQMMKAYSSWPNCVYPVLHVEHGIDPYFGGPVKFYLNKINKKTNETKPLWACVTYTTPKNPNITLQKWVSSYGEIHYVDGIENDDLVIIDVKYAGYYRINYDEVNSQKLVKYLNSAKHINIHVINRAKIIDDAFYMLSTNNLNFTFYKNLTNYLSWELDYVAWYPVFKILERVSGFFPFQQSTEVKEHFRKLLEYLLDNLSLDLRKESDFTICLRQEASKWACTLNSQTCKSKAIYNLMRFYEESISILPGWKEWTYCNGMMLADKFIWQDILTTKPINNKILEFLTCSENHTIIIAYINYLTSGQFTEVRHRITIFHSIITRHAKNDLVLDYLLQNFAKVIPSVINKSVALTDIINHLYSEKQLSKVNDFLRNHFSFKDSLHIGQKILVRLSEIERHINYFKRFLKT